VVGAREPEEDWLTFVQTPEFWYLTAVREPGSALIIERRSGRATSTIYVPPAHSTNGGFPVHRPGPVGIARQTGMTARPFSALSLALDSLLRAPGDSARLAVIAPGGSDDPLVAAFGRRHPGLRVEDVSSAVLKMRARKSESELAMIRKAVDITVMAEREAMRTVAPGMGENEIQALIEYTFRKNGAERPSFASIVGSGPNSTDLHYSTNDRVMAAGDVVVMDIGASYRGYSADVTRTVPVSGTFSPEQRALYTVVRDAQRAAERQAVLGTPARLMEDSARAVLARGLAGLGLIESVDATYDGSGCPRMPTNTGCPQWWLYYFHAIGHGIGLEVHDPDASYYAPGTIAAGSAFTIEPGLYVRDSLVSDVPDTPRNRAMFQRIGKTLERYRNIGIRIEDDYIATEQGVEWVSRAPRELEEVEASATQGGPNSRHPE